MDSGETEFNMIGNSEVITEGTIEALITVDQGQVSRESTNRDRIRCFEC